MEFSKKLQTLFFIWNCCMLLTVLSEQNRVMYTGYEAHRFVPNNEENLKFLHTLHEKNPGVIFLKQPGNKGASVDILFPSHLQTDLLKNLKDRMPNSLISDDVESLMDHETHIAQLESIDSGEFPFTTYWNLAKLFSFYKQMETLHPDMCKIEQYGESHEKRPLLAMVVSKSQPAPANKSVMLIDGGTHAREWITVMSCAYFLNELVTNKHQYNHILDNFVVILACCINPDGFTYSWTTNRLWRKNRTPNGGSLLSCVGVDPNRNYNIGHKGGGSSTDACAETYCGESPFSIPETNRWVKYAKTKKVVSYVSLHSYSQLILLSFGCRNVPARYKEFDNDMQLASQAAEALKAIHGTEYQCGNSDEILYEACGTSADWFKGVYGARYAYTFELRDQGTFGFILPSDQIQPCAEETAEGLKRMHHSFATQLLQQEKETENQE